MKLKMIYKRQKGEPKSLDWRLDVAFMSTKMSHERQEKDLKSHDLWLNKDFFQQKCLMRDNRRSPKVIIYG